MYQQYQPVETDMSPGSEFNQEYILSAGIALSSIITEYRVYHLIARTEYSLMVQILAGRITHLLLAIYCHKHFHERVSIARVRQLRNQIKKELRLTGFMDTETTLARAKTGENPRAKT